MAAEELASDQKQPGRDHHPGDQAQDLVGALLELGPDQAEPPGLGLQPGGVRVAADAIGADQAGAGHHGAAGQDGVAGLFAHRFGLPGEQRLVQLEPVGAQHRAVDGNLVPAAQFEHVVATPMTVLTTSTAPNSASCGGPMTRTTTNRAPRIALNRVSTLTAGSGPGCDRVPGGPS